MCVSVSLFLAIVWLFFFSQRCPGDTKEKIELHTDGLEKNMRCSLAILKERLKDKTLCAGENMQILHHLLYYIACVCVCLYINMQYVLEPNLFESFEKHTQKLSTLKCFAYASICNAFFAMYEYTILQHILMQ